MLERQHQFELGYTPESDDKNYDPSDLMRVATCYLDAATEMQEGENLEENWGGAHPFWPEHTGIPWNPEDTPEGNAVKGAAFAAAALDIIQLRRERAENA
jgi:hypothetical protein